MKIQKSNVGDFIDWFGKEFSVISETEDDVTLRFKVNLNAMYYWALQYGEIAEVIRPESLRTRLSEGIGAMEKKYERQKEKPS